VKERITLFVALYLVSATRGFAETPPKWVTFDRLCGSLEFFTPIPGGGNDSKPLKNVVLELYPWEEGISCCKLPPLFKTVTHKEGHYEFKNVEKGRYWLVSHFKGRALQMPIAFTSKGASNQDCEL
jgi:hypothetical protein